MINPSSLLVPDIMRSEKGAIVTLPEIPEYDEEDYDLTDTRDFKKYIDDIKAIVRRSFEYRQFISYIREWYGMTESAQFENINGEGGGVKIEIHHTPFSLYDIVMAVYTKRAFYHEDLSVFMVAKEVMELHYKMIIGVYPLTLTEHELVHNGYLFIPTYKVFGHYDIFRKMYEQFIDPELLDTLDDIEQYSRVSYDEEQTKRLLGQANIYLDTSGAYSLPILEDLRLALSERVDQIKQNAYMLPSFDDEFTNAPQQKTNQVYIEDTIYNPQEYIKPVFMVQAITFQDDEGGEI